MTNVNIAIDCVLLQAISIGIHVANNKSNSKAHSKILHISSANISLMVSNRPMLNDNVVFINYHQRHHQSSRALSVGISRFDRDPFSMQMFLYLHDPRRGVALLTVNGQFKCPRPKFALALVTWVNILVSSSSGVFAVRFASSCLSSIIPLSRLGPL